MSAEVACNERIPELENAYRLALGELKSYEVRTLASTSETEGADSDTNAPVQQIGLSDEEIAHWTKWAHDMLIKTQKIIDAAVEFSDDRELRAELSQSANDMVRVYGYATIGDGLRMRDAIAGVLERQSRARAKFCSGLRE